MMQSLLETASLSSLQRSSQLIGCAVRDALFLGMRIVHPAIQGFARVCSLVGVSNNTLPTLAATRLGFTGRQRILQLVEKLYFKIPELGKMLHRRPARTRAIKRLAHRPETQPPGWAPTARSRVTLPANRSTQSRHERDKRRGALRRTEHAGPLAASARHSARQPSVEALSQPQKRARQSLRHERLRAGDAYHLALADAAGDGRLVNNGSHHGYGRLDYYRAQLIGAARRL